jgi:hypothetical protein
MGKLLQRWARWLLAGELAAIGQAQAASESAQLQLTICRAMLATAMRERDIYAAALDHAAYELASCKRLRRRERQAARMWITREVKPHIRAN